MSPLIWAAFVFVLLLILFLMLAFLIGKHMSEPQYNILIFLSSLCAAFAGWFISGEALFKWEGTLSSGSKYFISGTSGFALAFVVWFFFPKYPEQMPLKDGFNVSVPDGWTFRQTVDTFAQRDRAVPSYNGFNPEELNAQLKQWEISTNDAREAMLHLRSITLHPNAIRKYEVRLEGAVYYLNVLDQ